jgi:hypothetical protein
MTRSYSARLNTAPEVMFRTIGDESVILNLNNERYLGLDAVGTRMWTLLNGLGSIQEAYESLLAEFDVEPVRLRHDLNELIDQLLEHGLIEITAAENVTE